MAESQKTKLPRANREIRCEQVRVIGGDGEMIGILPTHKALDMAKKSGLDLVEISPNAEPPVCKILDFSRFKYELKKKQQEAKKKQKKVALKEMKFKVNIGQRDLEVKLKKIKEFLEDGDKVKISLWFKGREIVHKDKGQELFDKILESLSNIAKIDVAPKFEGKQIMMVLSSAVVVKSASEAEE